MGFKPTYVDLLDGMLCFEDCAVGSKPGWGESSKCVQVHELEKTWLVIYTYQVNSNVTKYLVGGEYWILFHNLLSYKSLVKNDCYLWTCKRNRLNHRPTKHQQPVDASQAKLITLIHHNFGACHKSRTAHNSTTNVLNEPNLAKHLLLHQKICIVKISGHNTRITH